MHAGIGSGVGRRRGGTDSLDSPQRTGLYDGAATALLHGFGRRLGHEELAVEDGIEEPVVLGWTYLYEWLRIEDTCVVNQDVQATKFIYGQVDQCLSSGELSDIRCESADMAATGINVLCSLRQLSRVATADHYRRASRHQLLCNFLTDTRTTTGNNGNLVRKTFHILISSVVLN